VLESSADSGTSGEGEEMVFDVKGTSFIARAARHPIVRTNAVPCPSLSLKLPVTVIFRKVKDNTDAPP